MDATYQTVNVLVFEKSFVPAIELLKKSLGHCNDHVVHTELAKVYIKNCKTKCKENGCGICSTSAIFQFPMVHRQHHPAPEVVAGVYEAAPPQVKTITKDCILLRFTFHLQVN